MTSLTIKLPQRKLAQLMKFAAKAGVSPTDLVRESVEGLLLEPDVPFERAATRVLRKNAELYKRLA